VTTYQETAAELTKRGEKCVLFGYLDSGKVPTWGWGHTGPEVRVGQHITQAQADIDFIRDQAEADAALHSHVPPVPFAALTEHEKAALLDFCFNTGGGPLDKDEWTIWKDARAGRLDDIPTQLGRFVYVHVDGKPVTSRGLKNRRSAEIVLWNTADVDAAVATACAGGETACSASIRTLPTPPTSVAPKALAKTSLAVKVGGLFTGGAGVVANYLPDITDKTQAVHDLAVRHGSDNHYVLAVASCLSAALLCLGVAQLFIHHEQQQAAKV
jgi:lysozyme